MKTTTWRRWLTCAALLSLLLGACSGGDGDGDEGAGKESEETTTSAPDATTTTRGENPPGSETNPFPKGGSGDIGDGFVSKVVTVDTNAEAALKALDPATPAPPEGEQFVLVTFETTVTGEVAGVMGTHSLTDPESGARYTQFTADNQPVCGNAVDAYDSFTDAGRFHTGDTFTNQACFSVPSDAVGRVVVFVTPLVWEPTYFALS